MAPPVATAVDGPSKGPESSTKSGGPSVRSVVEKILYLNARKHVRQTMENHWDINDPDVADMVVHLARESRKEGKDSSQVGTKGKRVREVFSFLYQILDIWVKL